MARLLAWNIAETKWRWVEIGDFRFGSSSIFVSTIIKYKTNNFLWPFFLIDFSELSTNSVEMCRIRSSFFCSSVHCHLLECIELWMHNYLSIKWIFAFFLVFHSIYWCFFNAFQTVSCIEKKNWKIVIKAHIKNSRKRILMEFFFASSKK